MDANAHPVGASSWRRVVLANDGNIYLGLRGLLVFRKARMSEPERQQKCACVWSCECGMAPCVGVAVVE